MGINRDLTPKPAMSGSDSTPPLGTAQLMRRPWQVVVQESFIISVHLSRGGFLEISPSDCRRGGEELSLEDMR